MQLKDKVAIVTGGAQGIGEAIVRRFVREGAKVVLADIRTERGEAIARELGGPDQCLFVECDVGDAAATRRLVEETRTGFGGRIDVLVSSAGISHGAEFLDLAEADFDRVLRVNLKGPFLLGQAVARVMAEQAEGSIIHMSSINAVVASPHIVPYAVSKGGLNQLTRVMALGLAKHGIRVNGIGPGSIDTEQLASIIGSDEAAKRKILARTPMGRIGKAEEIASIALFLATSASSYMTGQTIYADGGRLPLAYTVPEA